MLTRLHWLQSMRRWSLSKVEKMEKAYEELDRLLFSILDSKAFDSEEKQQIGERLVVWSRSFEQA